MGMAPLDYGPVLLRMPFGSRLAADTLPSGCPCGQSATVGASPWLCPSFPTSCPCRVRHGRVPRPPPSLDRPPLIRAAEGLEPSGSKRCPAHTTSPSAPVPRIGTLALVGLPLELLP